MILITGASTGIGLTTARHFVQLGHHVLAGVRRHEDGQKLEELCRGLRGKVTSLILDVTQEEHQKQLQTYLEKSSEQLQGLVNNAGVVVAGPLEIIDLEKMRNLFEINVFGLLRTTQVCLPFLRKSRGRIVNISSVSGLTVTPILSPYCASKHCVEVFSDALRMELKPWEIEVALIEPGSIATPIWDKSLHKASQDLGLKNSHEHPLYGSLLQRFEKLAMAIANGASSPELVAKKIEHAMFSAKPKTRYLVGKGAKSAVLQRLLPDRWKDRLILKYLRS